MKYNFLKTKEYIYFSCEIGDLEYSSGTTLKETPIELKKYISFKFSLRFFFLFDYHSSN